MLAQRSTFFYILNVSGCPSHCSVERPDSCAEPNPLRDHLPRHQSDTAEADVTAEGFGHKVGPTENKIVCQQNFWEHFFSEISADSFVDFRGA